MGEKKRGKWKKEEKRKRKRGQRSLTSIGNSLCVAAAAQSKQALILHMENIMLHRCGILPSTDDSFTDKQNTEVQQAHQEASVSLFSISRFEHIMWPYLSASKGEGYYSLGFFLPDLEKYDNISRRFKRETGLCTCRDTWKGKGTTNTKTDRNRISQKKKKKRKECKWRREGGKIKKQPTSGLFANFGVEHRSLPHVDDGAAVRVRGRRRAQGRGEEDAMKKQRTRLHTRARTAAAARAATHTTSRDARRIRVSTANKTHPFHHSSQLLIHSSTHNQTRSLARWMN